MQARMQPIDRLFASLPRIVRELSQDLNKKVNLSVEGADTELDRQLIETIRDPLTHIIRNCIDHGIESPEDRLAVHKPQTGVIRIIASQDAGFISIRISDDGRGIDVARVRQKALELNLADAAQLASMSNDDICRFVFAPGFSTAGTVTNVSGRGVGMDIVREHVESIGGTVALTTTAGQGTTITLKVPLTLAIVPALIFTVAGNRFAIPQDAVVEAVSSDDGESGRLKTVQGNQFFTLRDKVIPVADMRRICRLPEPTAEKYNNANSIVIISRIGTTNFAITVDELADVQEIVVKPLSSPLIHLNVFSGNTILGDGSVVLIINPVGLANAIGLDSTKQYSVNIAHDNDPNHRDVTSLILFRGNSGIHKALPLSLLSRIEEVRTQDVMESDGRLLINHNGNIMPAIDLAGFSGEREKWPVLVVGVGGAPMGLLVSEIVDTVDHALEIDIAGRTPSVIGTTRVRDHITEILDLTYFMQQARHDEYARRHARRFRIMVIDDKPFFRDMLAPIVAASGYEVSTAGSAEEALTTVRRGATFDAILTDIDMPDVTGYELTRLIRELPAYQKVPVIALDAYAGEEVLRAAKLAGMDGVVGKFDRKSLVETLHNCLMATAFQNAALETALNEERAA